LKIIRVFPAKTSYAPGDGYCFFDVPPLPVFIPEHGAVPVCSEITRDRARAEHLLGNWAAATDKPTLLGGPAYGGAGGDFVPGRYVRPGITFTSRGCPNSCPWCFVPRREGRLRELPVQAGNIIQDNNFLACSKAHKNRAFEMLKTQRAIEFRGGLQPDLVDDHFAEAARGLRVKRLWLACDTDGAIPALARAAGKLAKAGFGREKLRCYVLIGQNGMDADEARLRAVYEAGCMPFAQLYRAEEPFDYPARYRKFARMWQRPAATRAHMEKGTNFEDFGT
jgi:hypothetical protein